MRAIVEPQLCLASPWINFPQAAELREMSELLDEHVELAELIQRDLVAGISGKRGRAGLSGDQTLRVLVVKQLNGFSYSKLAFHLADSRSYRRFCRFGEFGKPPRKSALQEAISRIRPATLEAVSWRVVQAAVAAGLETADRVRVDTTVTETNIHHPADSSLLYDCVRVLGRLFKKARRLSGIRYLGRNHTKAAKRRVYKINQAKRQAKRVPFYRDLVRLCEQAALSADTVVQRLVRLEGAAAARLVARIQHFRELAVRVIDQTKRRVFAGESVPARDKVASIFEEHTDVIRKGGRETAYGHKLCLTVGRSTLVLDCTIEDGAPNDRSLAVDMVKRLADSVGKLPAEVAFDGGFTSRQNLADIKALGVKEVMFHRKAPLTDVSEMTSTPQLHKELWCFRAGVEGCISFLKRCFGLRRATWKGHDGFKRFVRASVLTMNLLTIARLRLSSA